MEIRTTTEGSEATFVIEGWLDTQTAPQLGEALDALGAEVEHLTMDCSALEYISSAGIRQLVAAYKKTSGNLTLTHVSPEVREVLRMTGVDKRLDIR